MEKFEQWLLQLGKVLKLDDKLTLDDKNECFLLFDEKMLVCIEYYAKDNVFSFKGNLGNVDDKKVNYINNKLLEANFLYKETNGATFGLEKYSDKILLVQRTCEEDCDYEGFEKYLELFIDTFEYWLKKLASS